MAQRLYHEAQVGQLCGVHALNAVLQGPAFNEVDLATIGQALDAEERRLGVGDAAAAGTASQNVQEDGFFSITVLTRALESYSLDLVPLKDPRAVRVRARPEADGEAFVCWLDSHYFALRKCEGTWWNLNSLLPGPQKLSDTYLATYLAQLQAEGYSVFVVCGDLRRAAAPPGQAVPREGRYWTPEEADRAAAAAAGARQGARYGGAIEAALARAARGETLHGRAAPRPPTIDLTDEADDLQAALEASARESEERQLAQLLARSLEER